MPVLDCVFFLGLLSRICEGYRAPKRMHAAPNTRRVSNRPRDERDLENTATSLAYFLDIESKSKLHGKKEIKRQGVVQVIGDGKQEPGALTFM
jgi:hypothetical protein